MYKLTTLPLGVTRIDLVPAGLTGFEHFIAAYVYQHGKEVFLIDIGPASTAPGLFLALRGLGVTRVDYVLLTHIHLDHAGAAGQIARAFPGAQIVCHPKGLKHLHRPQKLWQGSLAVLKDFAMAYHEPAPVPLERLAAANEFNHAAVRAINTPGHAPHHLSFLFNDYLFIGEAAGVFFNLGKEGYLRPATPPRFEMEQARQSLETLEALKPKRTAFAHYGLSENGLVQIKAAQNQLNLWAATAKRVMLDQGRGLEACIDELLRKDENMQNFYMFNALEQKREAEFFANALAGILGWLKTLQ